jgi:hypothetical protein
MIDSITLTTGHYQMRYMVKSLLGLAFLGLATGLAGPLQAQTAKPGEPEVLPPGEIRGGSPFRLFGERDYAMSGLRMPGDFTGCVDNSGDITTENQCWSNFNPAPVFMPDWFDMMFYFAVPPSERNKHAVTVPSLANAAGKGYTVNSYLSEYTGETLAHDGTLGPFHAGATEAGDGSCLDFRVLGSGNPLLAGSDCPPSWGSAGWQGTRFVDQDGFLGFADEVGDADFSFDTWRVPDDLRRNDKYLGNFQTFGYFSDYSLDALFGSGVHPSYGNVIPESMGGDPAEAPTRSGWPLGMLAKMDAFAFFSPGLANTAWFQITVVNNSAEVYGVGLDYDSLYMGLQPGWLTYEQGTSLYRSPGTGTVRGATFCQTPTCGPGGDPMHPGDQWGSIPPNGIGTGFNYGAAAIVVMKSPIGDLRNKKFTQDPLWLGKGDSEIYDDTITFNHSHMCGYHGCSAVVWNAAPSTDPNTDYEQRQFGMIASIPSDVLGSRAVSDPSDHTMWDTFRWEEYPDRAQLDFNRWTPGGWDWDGDLVDDELAYDDCSDNAGAQFDEYVGYSKNCSVSWSDTLPGGFGNVYANRGAVVGAGPFPMAAGDTVEWIFAIVSANDLAGIEADIAKAIDHYNAFFLGPEPAPAPTITSVDVAAGGGSEGPDGQPQAEITFYFDDTTETWEDPFLQKFLDDMLAAGEDTDLGKIRDLNPFLEDTLRALIPNNVEFIHVFKSCDGGGTFTDEGDCFADPATGGIYGDLGWLPWASLEPDADGNFQNVVYDNGIFGGRSFLYTLVTETRGLTVAVQTGDVLDRTGAEVLCVSGCGSEILEVTPKLTPSITTSSGAPQVASVYIPVSQQPGFTPADIELVTASPDFVPFDRMNVQPTTDATDDGDYGMMFGDVVTVTETATLTATGAEVTQTVVDLDGTTQLTAPGPVAVEGDFEETVVDDQRTRVWTFDALTAVLADGDGVPLTVTADLEGGQTVPGAYFGLANFPGFTFSIDNTVGGSFSGQYYLDANEELIGPLVEPAVTFLEGSASGVTAEGRYRVTWADQPYGSGSPFMLDFTDPDGTREMIVQSLEGRALGQTASTDADLASLVGVAPEALLPVRLPFTIENVTDADSPTPVQVVITSAAKTSEILVGIDLDTLYVEVPETEWVPGEELILVEGSAPDYEVTYGGAVLGCLPATWQRTSCNPVALQSPGATGYIPAKADEELHFGYYQTITSTTEYTFAVNSAVSGSDLMASDRDAIVAELDQVRVVPNPFVMYSAYSTGGNTDRIIFTHVPPQGVLRVFTAAGQFVQQLNWTPEDLNERGDLWFNLRTKEGLEMAAGLYLYVLTAQDENGAEIGTAKGKFVLIK